MELDELKKNWQSLEIKVANEEAESAKLLDDLRSNRAQNIVYRLMSKSVRLAVVCLAFAVVFAMSSSIAKVYGAYSCVMSGYLAICAVTRFYLYYRLKHTDYIMLPLKEAVKQASSLEMLFIVVRRISLILGIPVLIGVFTILAIYTDVDERVALISCGIAGAIVGVAIGLKIKRGEEKLIKEMRSLIEEVNEEVDDNKS
jgi:hypothetical protein